MSFGVGLGLVCLRKLVHSALPEQKFKVRESSSSQPCLKAEDTDPSKCLWAEDGNEEYFDLQPELLDSPAETSLIPMLQSI
ncbi:uncharacterized protein FOMMEDRAFT_157743 [Fomitiporia mediterranea MF3/22]|uniref:uncharacterized protein n=1 Tax=Fomitiporia mediterranea (strain MF3/22) TaxID=694068 RepID=UPI00044094D3|nr:uncharacterized protein FOMMEDRAFT_157743 [Fomitiporia mediterranea MF3/22]EJD02520.1 hypothetical protein FOMMEDRAFT_157743 [Fomitiporia mediterranea MF3/22]